ncbi:MAG: hypothetical protein ABI977_33055 [Acidobacteriota bacterium]
MQKILDEAEEKELSLKDVTEEGTLPGEKAKRSGAKKKFLMVAALCALLVITAVGAYFLLGGKHVQVKAGRKVTERITNGADLQRAAYDSLRGSLSGLAAEATSASPAINVGSGQPAIIAMPGVSPSPSPIAASSGVPKASTPAQSGIALTLAPPVEAATPKLSERSRQQGEANTETSTPERKTGNAAAPSASGARPNVGASITFASPRDDKSAKTKEEAKTNPAESAKSLLAGEPLHKLDANQPALKRAQRSSDQGSGPSFGAMLPVRSMGVLYTLRPGNLARFELARDIRAGNWALKRGTVFVGSVLGSDVDRAYVQIKGFIDPETSSFTRLEGETLGSDGGAGLRGKRRRVSSVWVKVLDRAAQSGTQILTGVLGRRDSSVIVATDPYGTYRSGAGYDQSQLQNNRTFVEVAAGTVGFVLVTTLPEPSKPDAHLVGASMQDELSSGAVPDVELAELLVEADPERIREALPRMNPELRRVAEGVLAEIEAKKK